MNEILILTALLLLSGLFSGSETALVALSKARAEGLAEEGRRGAHALLRLKQDQTRMLITILIGNNLVNIAASAMATVVATERFGHIGPGIAVGVLTILILIFGEITPKSLATRYAERISLAISPLMLFIMRLLFPLVWLFAGFTSWIHHHTGGEEDPTVTESELINLLGHGEREGIIESVEREMIKRVFDFGDLRLEDVMTPRHRIYALDGALTVQKALPEVVKGAYSRIPVYGQRTDEIRKVVYLRDMLEAIARDDQDATLMAIGREPIYAPENQPIAELFTTLRTKRRQFAVVVDEHGDVQGIVTVEDLLEELVGEIYDESDDAPRDLRVLPGDKVAVTGGAELRVIEEHFQIEIPGKPTDTVSLWILDRTERIPESGERFSFDGLDIEVQEASGRRIHRVVLSRTPPEITDDDEGERQELSPEP